MACELELLMKDFSEERKKEVYDRAAYISKKIEEEKLNMCENCRNKKYEEEDSEVI